MHSKTKEEAYSELVSFLSEKYHIDQKQNLENALNQRESCASTFLPLGVAIPHARTSAVKDVSIVMGIAPKGISDDGEIPVKANVFFMFFTPDSKQDFCRHLKILANIAAIFNKPNFADELSKISSPEDILKKLKERETELQK